MEQILILMATYNGSKYIGPMIDSILQQDYTRWRLIISDDCSSDDSSEIARQYSDRYPQKIYHFRSGIHFGSAQKHFMYLLQQFHNAPYIMFCDQDDVWHRDKITKTLRKMKEIEKPGIPAMVHTDLRVVDQDLREISPSFIRYSTMNGRRMSLNYLLIQNVVTGCAMMLNRTLAEKGVEHIPEDGILMHDWWLALLASATGTTGYLNEATIDYRQHKNNTVGAKNTTSPAYIIQKVFSGNIRDLIFKTVQQAKALSACYADEMPADCAEIVRKYAELDTYGFWKRRYCYARNRFYKCGIARIIAQMIWG